MIFLKTMAGFTAKLLQMRQSERPMRWQVFQQISTQL